MKITLPFLPDRALSPNSRRHWSVKAKATKLARNQGFLFAKHGVFTDLKLEEKIRDKDTDLALQIQFVLPDRRRRDLDNLHAALKAYLDGIAQGLGFDDSQIKKTTLLQPEVKKGERAVKLEISLLSKEF